MAVFHNVIEFFNFNNREVNMTENNKKAIDSSEFIQPTYIPLKKFVKRTGLPTASVNKMIKDGHLPSILIGKRRMIPSSCLKELPVILEGVENGKA